MSYGVIPETDPFFFFNRHGYFAFTRDRGGDIQIRCLRYGLDVPRRTTDWTGWVATKDRQRLRTCEQRCTSHGPRHRQTGWESGGDSGCNAAVERFLPVVLSMQGIVRGVVQNDITQNGASQRPRLANSFPSLCPIRPGLGPAPLDGLCGVWLVLPTIHHSGRRHVLILQQLVCLVAMNGLAAPVATVKMEPGNHGSLVKFGMGFPRMDRDSRTVRRVLCRFKRQIDGLAP
ncbi:hypothetical protein B0T14DRAFT_339997 [Immersiella caudata]|uniref:Uncharacterized protein n=1 Tax=Immersiella caudata TaxID=314043 RepID=A0AA39T208_9PEZI|nr:hypothetical protein B0T14DRAFT_339997 [Immersiella caudata]